MPNSPVLLTLPPLQQKRSLTRRDVLLVLESGKRPSIQWDCPICLGFHSGTPWKNAASFAAGQTCDGCNPDIAAFDATGRPVVFIQVVDTRPVPHAVYDVAAKHQIPVIEIKIGTEAIDRGHFKEAAWRAERVTVNCALKCLGPKCGSCNDVLQRRELDIYSVRCRCFGRQKFPLVSMNRTNPWFSSLTITDLDLAGKHGVLFRMEGDSLVTVCPRCQTTAGSRDPSLGADRRELVESIDLGLQCPSCAEESCESIRRRERNKARLKLLRQQQEDRERRSREAITRRSRTEFSITRG